MSRFIKKHLLIFLVLILVLFRYRQIFAYHFNPSYWENFYYESQWIVPNSKREISDEGVYRYVGFCLVNGENPFNVDYWVPPLGKYLYGLTAKYFTNPYLTSAIIYFFSVLFFYLLSLEFLAKPKAILATTLYLLNPLLVSQLNQTMLDLPLSFFLLGYLLFFTKYLKNLNPKKSLLIAAVFLGLSAGTKAPFYVVVALVFSSFILLFQKKPSKVLILFLFSLIGYMLAYFSYFMHHPNPIPWIRLHQKVIEFQSGMRGTNYPLNILEAFFLLPLATTMAKVIFFLNGTYFYPCSFCLFLKFFFKKPA